MSNKTLIFVIIIILVLFGGVVAYSQYRSKHQDNYGETTMNDQDVPTTTPTPEASVSPSPSTTPTTEVTQSGDCKRNFSQEKLTNDKVAIQNRQVEMQVKGFGTIKLEFYDKDAPKTVENFLRLTNSGYFDCLTFHRVAKGFVIQGGDPSGNGTGGFSAFGEKFADELNPNTASYKAGYKKGVLAMANSGPNTNGSQFFIMLGDVELDHAYTIFGKVTSGLDVVDKIGQVDITPQMGPNDGAPKTPVVMSSVKIIK